MYKHMVGGCSFVIVKIGWHYYIGDDSPIGVGSCLALRLAPNRERQKSGWALRVTITAISFIFSHTTDLKIATYTLNPCPNRRVGRC